MLAVAPPNHPAGHRGSWLLLGADDYVARWARRQQNSYASHLDMCVGVMRDSVTTGRAGAELVGAFAFNHYNGCDAELHFYGPGTLKKDIVRAIFGIALQRFNLQRLTVRTRSPAMARGMRKLGAVFECRQLRVYGPTDAPEHAAEQYVFYRERMERLARGGSSDVR